MKQTLVDNAQTRIRTAYEQLREVMERHGQGIDLPGQVVVITGASRGLGFILANQFGREGCRLAICARGQDELERARTELVGHGFEVFAQTCDIADQQAATRFIEAVTGHYGRIDILVNNAGVIQVGPLPSMTIADFEEAMDIMFWGVLYPTLAVLPQMRRRHSGRIVNITSIGGKISAPHLLPYGAAKFAAVGLSEGLRAELARDAIAVTTVVPGLMRTGSHRRAFFKGERDLEYTWFSLGATLPIVSMDAERAAAQIVDAARTGKAEVILGTPAAVAARFHGLFPGVTTEVLGLVNRLLPDPDKGDRRRAEGRLIEERMNSPLFRAMTSFGRSAARRFMENR